ncbi:MAG: hypothetical protein WAR83_06220 [Flavobacteriales bacterium]|nr:hypothetical protein [Flavobacteriales bacterium]
MLVHVLSRIVHFYASAHGFRNDRSIISEEFYPFRYFSDLHADVIVTDSSPSTKPLRVSAL